MKRFNSRAVLPIATLAIGMLWLFVGLIQYGWWEKGRAQSGFFPAIVGGFLIFISTLAILAELKEEKPHFIIAYTYPVLSAVGMVILARLIGFFPALVIYLFGWLKFYEKYGMLVAGLTTIVTSGMAYGIFFLWLRVPFPSGILLELL